MGMRRDWVDHEWAMAQAYSTHWRQQLERMSKLVWPVCIAALTERMVVGVVPVVSDFVLQSPHWIRT